MHFLKYFCPDKTYQVVISKGIKVIGESMESIQKKLRNEF